MKTHHQLQDGSNERLVDLVQEYESKYAQRTTAAIHRHIIRIAVVVFASIFFTDLFSICLILVTLFLLTSPFELWFWLLLSGFFLLIRVWGIICPRDDSATKPIRIKRKEYPELFAAIDDVSAITKTRVNKVFMAHDFNAGARKVPRLFGLLGSSNWLLLGLPLLMSISKQEFRGLLGHEFFHFSKHQAYEPIIRSAMVAAWNLSFSSIRVFNPWHGANFSKLSALSIVLGKKNERLADQAARNITSHLSEAVQALRCGIVQEQILEKAILYKPEFLLSAPSPPDNLMDLHRQEIAKATKDQDSVLALLNDITIQIHSKFEIHPTWYERVKTLDMQPTDPQLINQVINYEPATELLGKNLSVIETKLNQQWIKEVKNGWEVSYRYETDRKKDLVPENEVTEYRDIMDHVHALNLSSGIESTEQWVNKALDIKPNDNIANCMLAEIQLKKGEPEAEKKLEMMICEKSLKVANMAYAALSRHFQRTGNSEGLKRVETEYDLLIEQANELHFALVPSPYAEFEPAKLSKASLNSCRQHFEKFRFIRNVYAARQVVKCCPDTEFIVFIVTFRTFSWVPNSFWQKLVDGISLGGAYFHFLPARPNKLLLKKIRNLAGSEIYQSEK